MQEDKKKFNIFDDKRLYEKVVKEQRIQRVDRNMVARRQDKEN